MAAAYLPLAITARSAPLAFYCMPGIGAATTNIERGLNAAIKGSDMGLKAIDIGERASKIKGVGDAGAVYRDARSLYKQARP